MTDHAGLITDRPDAEHLAEARNRAVAKTAPAGAWLLGHAIDAAVRENA